MELLFNAQGLSEKTISEILEKSFLDDNYNSFTCIVAFTSVAGAKFLKNLIENSKFENFFVCVGIDLKGTSKEALEVLLTFPFPCYIYYTSSRIIFHPKLYIFEGNDNKIILGSSNLTSSGLSQNIENNIILSFNNKDEEGNKFLESIKQEYNLILNNKSENIKQITQDLINDLFEAGIVPDETKRKEIQDKTDEVTHISNDKDKVEVIKKLFPTIKLNKSLSVSNPQKKYKVKETPIKLEPEKKENLMWSKKNLPASDVLGKKKGTNPTGGLRLTKAGWKIDQTKYFRDVVFKDLNWEKFKDNPFTEIAKGKFIIKVDGSIIARKELSIRHKPSGEAGQNNYTTLLSWTGVSDKISENNLTGKDLYLYKLRPDIFLMEISSNQSNSNSLLDF